MAKIPVRGMNKDSTKGGTFLGGVGGGGPSRYKSSAERPAGPPGRNPSASRTGVGGTSANPGKSAAEKQAAATVRGGKNRDNVGRTGPTGSGSPKAEWSGSGENKKYRDIPEQNKDRGKVSTPKGVVAQKRDEAEAGVNMGGSRQVGSRTSSSSGSAGKAGVGGTSQGEKRAPAVPGTLNYFMRKTGGRKNAAYTMYKKYKQAQRRGDTA